MTSPRVLLVKTSSMGDVIHTLPALSDAARALPGVRFDWVVEPGFAEIPGWHPAVDRVVEVGLRQWRRQVLHTLRTAPWRELGQRFAGRDYVAAIDAQGLLKSAWIGLLQGAPRFGYDWHSAREPLSALCYQHRVAVAVRQHAVDRSRQLLARALNYRLPDAPPDYGIDRRRLPAVSLPGGGLVFLHGTSRADKHWPEHRWAELCDLAGAGGYRVSLPWGGPSERERAQRLAAGREGVCVLPAQGLGGLAALLDRAAGVVAVDTGLGHLAAALGAPCVSLYGPTDPYLIGAMGRHQVHLRAADGDLDTLAAGRVWATLEALMAESAAAE